MDKNEVITISSDEESDFTVRNHSKPGTLSNNEPLSSKKKVITEDKINKMNNDTVTGNIETGTNNIVSEFTVETPKLDVNYTEEMHIKDSKSNEGFNQNLELFTEFVEQCGSLEEIPNDRAKLTKKLMKRYGEADCDYIKSEEFKSLIQKFRDKVTKDNLYIIAQKVANELMYRKKIEIKTGKSENQRSLENGENSIIINENKKKGNKKKAKVIKIIKKLDKLGIKIRELEEKEVDLSDEEDSAYVQLQRYRERFYQIYTKLSKFTDEVSDIDRVYNRRICFTESKYPEINKCIEKWLNKTKRFPDLSDVIKLLESQSSSLGLPSNQEEIRVLANEIFQQVGSMLQRRRKYDLWDSFCGYLDDSEDPASKDALLDEVLKRNYEIRVKKEQEIFQHYAELQEKQRLEPEEVPDEEANRSPVESGNEDEDEIERIEEQINLRMDEAIKEDTEGKANSVTEDERSERNQDLEKQIAELTPKAEDTQSKESKNNYKNCKSLKWRTEKGLKASPETINSEDSNMEENDKEKEAEISEQELSKEDVNESMCRRNSDPDSDLELIAVKNVSSDTMGGIFGKIKAETKSFFESPLKRKLMFEGVASTPTKRIRSNTEEEDDLEVYEVEDENDGPGKKGNEVIDIHCCQIFSENVFDAFGDETKKDWGKRKVFRDLTNLNRLMELHGKQRKMSGLFSPSFFHRSFFEFEKSSWRNKFKASFKSFGSRVQKCALNQEKSGKTVNSDSGGDSDEKDIHNNSEGRGEDEGNNFFSGNGNGSEGDNNEDENKKNGKRDFELSENQREEDDEEEEEEEEDENAESEHSLHNQKTEELENKTPSESSDKSNEKEEEMMQRAVLSETQNDEEKGGNDDSNSEKENKEEENREEHNDESHVEEGNEENNSEEIKGGSNLEEEKEECNLQKENKRSNTEEIEESNSEKVDKEESKSEKVDKEESNSENVDKEESNIEEQKEESRLHKGENNAEKKEECNLENEDRPESNAEEDIEERYIEKENKESTSEKKDNKSNIEEDNLEQNTLQKEKTSAQEVTCENQSVEPELEEKTEVSSIKKEEAKDSKPEKKELEAENKSKVTAEKKQKKDIDIVAKFNPPNQNSKFESKRIPSKESNKSEKIMANSSARVIETRLKTRSSTIPKEYESAKIETRRHSYTTNKPATSGKSFPMDSSTQNVRKRSAPSTSDEEIVKRFLLHSPSSISITPPRKLTLSKSPSEAALQALATLRKLKGISATIVRGKPKNDTTGSSYSRPSDQNNQNHAKRGRGSFPVISNVQTVTPKIVNVSGNVSGFDNSWPGMSNAACDSSPIRISNVWGSLPNNFMQSMMTEGVSPGCSSQKSNPGPSNAVKKKNTKKPVEYVVLD